mgnify:CR=1 FL=1
MAEVQRICDRVAIIDKGKILLAGATDELRGMLQSKQVFRIRVAGDIESAAAVAERAEFVEEANVEADTIVVKISDPIENNSRLMLMLIQAGFKIIEFAEEEVTLEDLYLSVIDREGD